MRKQNTILLLAMSVSLSALSQSTTVENKKADAFADDANALSLALYNYEQAQKYGGDTVTLRSILESKHETIISYGNVQAEMEARPDLQNICHIVCAIIWSTCYKNNTYGHLSWQICLSDYRQCMNMCGLIPTLALSKGAAYNRR